MADVDVPTWDRFTQDLDEQIVSGFVNEAGQLVLVQRDGTEINSGQVRAPDLRQVKVYTPENAASPNGAVWSKPEGATRIRVILIGGGAGSTTGGQAGRGGAVFDLTLTADMFNATETVICGRAGGGQQGGAIPQPASKGGDSSMTIKGQLFVAEGGDVFSGKGIADVLRGATALLPSFSFRQGGSAGGGAGHGNSPGYYGFRLNGEEGDPLNGIPGGGGAYPGGGGGGAGVSGADGVVVVISHFTVDQN